MTSSNTPSPLNAIADQALGLAEDGRDERAAVDFAIDAPRHVNLGLIEITPTFQVPGGLTFDRREA